MKVKTVSVEVASWVVCVIERCAAQPAQESVHVTMHHSVHTSAEKCVEEMDVFGNLLVNISFLYTRCGECGCVKSVAAWIVKSSTSCGRYLSKKRCRVTQLEHWC